MPIQIYMIRSDFETTDWAPVCVLMKMYWYLVKQIWGYLYVGFTFLSQCVAIYTFILYFYSNTNIHDMGDIQTTDWARMVFLWKCSGILRSKYEAVYTFIWYFNVGPSICLFDIFILRRRHMTHTLTHMHAHAQAHVYTHAHTHTHSNTHTANMEATVELFIGLLSGFHQNYYNALCLKGP